LEVVGVETYIVAEGVMRDLAFASLSE